MFVENYKLETLIGGQAQSPIPYAKISDADRQKWKMFLPVSQNPFRKKVLFDTTEFLLGGYGISPEVRLEMRRAAGHRLYSYYGY